MSYELFHGDCLDILPTLEAQSIDAVIADIPSGRTACAWDSVIPFELMWAELKRITKPRAAIVLLGCTQPFTSALVMSNPGMFRYEWVWLKNRKTNHLNARIMPMMSTESVCLFGRAGGMYNPQMRPYSKNTHANNGYVNTHTNVYRDVRVGQRNNTPVDINGVAFPDNILRFDCVRNPIHPTQKPLALLEYLVKTYTNAGDLVLDFTFGSGTTGAACGNLGRRFVGTEKDLNYFTLGSERIATAYEPLRAMQVAV